MGPPPPELLTAFERAFTEHICLGFRYTDRHGKVTQRTAEPHGLLLEPPAWYLLTRDADSHEPRMFRMDRMQRVCVLESQPFRPDFERLREEHVALRDAGAPPSRPRPMLGKE